MTATTAADRILEALDRVLEADRTTTKYRAVRPLERKLAAQLRRTWKGQKRAVLQVLARHRTSWPKPTQLEEAVDPARLEVEVAGAVRPDLSLIATIDVIAARALAAGAATTIVDASVGVVFGLEWPEATRFLSDYGAARVAAIDDTTRDELRQILVRSSEETWSYQQTAREITSRFDSFSARRPQLHVRNRAELVSITETAYAYEAGADIASRRLIANGLVLEKRWLTAGDERVCPICAPNSGRWVPYHEAFASGHDSPPAHPACRCATERRVKKAERR